MQKRHGALIAAVALVMGCGALFACGSKSKKKTDTSATTTGTATPAGTGDAKSDKTEVVTGELAEVILKLRRVHFAFDTATLTDDSRQILKEVADTLTKHPDVHIYVQGHADSAGSDEYNIALGDKRAKAVADYLTALGIDPSRLHTISYGEERPLEAGDSEIQRAKNRRVDFRLMRGDVRLIVVEGHPVDDEGAPVEDPDASDDVDGDAGDDG